MAAKYPELAYYALPGHVSDPRPLVDEVRLGEEMGFGSVWISERVNTKNVAVLSGLASAYAPTMGIASGLIANVPLRHPLMLASYASTMALLTQNRFALGMGRGQAPLSIAAGLPPSNFRLLEDYIQIMRTLWRGEPVTYSGVAGNLNGVSLGLKLDVPPPVIMAVMGDKTAYWAGQHCDGVVYNSMWSPQAIAASTKIVRKGAADAGKDPASVRVWAIAVTACDVPEAEMLTFVIRRMNTYLAMQGMYESICEANGWDFAVIERVKRLMAEIDGEKAEGTIGDEHTSRDLNDIRRAAEVYPQSWIDQGSIVGDPKTATAKIIERFDAGADGVLLHGSTPAHLGTLIDRWALDRPAARFAGLSVNPGL